MVFHCTIAHSSASCFLYLEGQNKAELFSKEQGDFNLSHVHKGNGGRYSCQCYNKGASFKWSAVSKTLDLVVKGETSPNHVLLFLPGTCYILGELEKTMWGKKAAAIEVQAEQYSFLQMCLSLANFSETLPMTLQAQGCQSTSWGARIRRHLCLHLPAPGQSYILSHCNTVAPSGW